MKAVSAVTPDGWSIEQIDDIYDKLDTGKRFDQKTAFSAGAIPVVDQSADGFVGYNDEEPGVVGSPSSPVVTFANHTCEMRIMRRPFSAIQNVFALKGRDGVCETLYLYYGTKGRVYLEEYKGHYPDYRRLWIPLPPLPEQRRIAKILGDLDDKIELNRKMNETLEQMARALFKSWFVDFDPVRAKMEGRTPTGMDAATAALFPDRLVDSELGPIPEGWRVNQLRDVSVINALTLAKSDILQTIEYIEISEVNRGNIARIASYPRGEEPSRARRRLQHGDTVLSTVRPDRGCYFLALHPPLNRLVSTGFAVITPTEVSWSLLHAALTQPEVSDHLGQLADGGAYPAVDADVIGALELVLPVETTLIEEYHRQCASFYQLAEINRIQSRTLSTLRDTLLPKLVGGEVRVVVGARLSDSTIQQ
jgi:type I restriction enzyme S subunit